MHPIARHLSRRDPVLGRIIAEHGFRPLPRLRGTHFAALARSIAFQQLTPRAAAPIWARVCALFPGACPTPAAVLSTSPRRLRAAGLSGSKARFIRGAARAFHAGPLRAARLGRLPVPALLETLTALDGVGVWTAEMFLIFRLGRTDVLPLGDYGLRRAVRLAYGRRPTDAAVRRLGALWAPYQAVACWQLWKWLEA